MALADLALAPVVAPAQTALSDSVLMNNAVDLGSVSDTALSGVNVTDEYNPIKQI
jgi:hypothetical protein